MQALVIWIDYCNAICVGLPLMLTHRFHWVQNAAARLIYGWCGQVWTHMPSSGLPAMVACYIPSQVQGIDAYLQYKAWDHATCQSDFAKGHLPIPPDHLKQCYSVWPLQGWWRNLWETGSFSWWHQYSGTSSQCLTLSFPAFKASKDIVV